MNLGLKLKIISTVIRFVMGAIALGIGIWYISSALKGGPSLTYSSMDDFMKVIGVENGDIGTANGCFLCTYIAQLFGTLGNATELFWNAIVENLWLLMAIGFGIFLFIYTGQYIFDAAKTTTKLDTSEKKLQLQAWFDKVWRQGARILVAGAFLGMMGLGGTSALRAVTQITVTPVMYVGTELAMVATGINDAAKCNALANQTNTDDILNPVLGPLMCVMGNLNSVMLAGAAGGFALMNYAWMGLGAGALTWVGGLALVIMFLVIGFDLFFQVLSVVFKLIFLIVFLPLLIAATAWEGTWALAGGVISGAIKMLVNSALQIVAITLKILIVYATVSFAMDENFPGANALPPLMGHTIENPDEQTSAVTKVFQTCEQQARIDGELDPDAFQECFITNRAIVEQEHPGAFDFMDNGWDFIVMMIFLFGLYYYVISPRIDGLLGKDATEKFDFGSWIKDFGKTLWSGPRKIFEFASKKITGK